MVSLGRPSNADILQTAQRGGVYLTDNLRTLLRFNGIAGALIHISASASKHLYEWLPSKDHTVCRHYFDLEVVRPGEYDEKTDLEIVTSATAAIQREYVHPAIYLCHSHGKAPVDGFKYSYHILLDIVGTPADAETRCRNINRHPLTAYPFDIKVYTNRQNIRTVLSSKEGQDRPMLPKQGMDPIDTFIQTGLPSHTVPRSVVGDTAVPVPAYRRRSAYSLSPARAARAARSYLSLIGISCASLKMIRGANGSLTLMPHTRHCGIAKRQHASNHVYVKIDANRTATQRCHSQDCARRQRALPEVPSELYAEMTHADLQIHRQTL